MAARKRKPTSKKTGGSKLDSASVSPKASVTGLKKRTDNSTSYSGAKPKPVYHSSSVKVPNYPVGQLHKKVTLPVKKSTGPVKRFK